MTFKNSTFWKIWLKELNFFDSENWTFFWIWLTELIAPFFFKNMTHKKVTQRIEPTWTNLTQRIEPSLWIWFKKRTFFFFSICLKELNAFFFFEEIWLKDLLFFFEKKRLTLRIECDSKTWTFSKLWLTELNPSSQHDSKNWTLFWQIADSKYYLILFGKYDSKNWTFFEYDSKTWTSLFDFLWPKEFFFWKNHSKNWIFSKENVSKNWTIFSIFDKKRFTDLNLSFQHDSKKIETFFSTWLKEIEPIFECDSKNIFNFTKFDSKE